MLKGERRVESVWIFGPAGTGKSTLAKLYAKRKGEPFFVSGSTRDIFQGYEGKHTVILTNFVPHPSPTPTCFASRIPMRWSMR